MLELSSMDILLQIIFFIISGSCAGFLAQDKTWLNIHSGGVRVFIES